MKHKKLKTIGSINPILTNLTYLTNWQIKIFKIEGPKSRTGVSDSIVDPRKHTHLGIVSRTDRLIFHEMIPAGFSAVQV